MNYVQCLHDHDHDHDHERMRRAGEVFNLQSLTQKKCNLEEQE